MSAPSRLLLVEKDDASGNHQELLRRQLLVGAVALDDILAHLVDTHGRRGGRRQMVHGCAILAVRVGWRFRLRAEVVPGRRRRIWDLYNIRIYGQQGCED